MRSHQVHRLPILARHLQVRDVNMPLEMVHDLDFPANIFYVLRAPVHDMEPHQRLRSSQHCACSRIAHPCSAQNQTHVSLRFAIDLQAYCLPVFLSSANRVVPNWPRPSTLPRV